MSNKTPNYQLNQWEPGDSFLRTDFNEDNAKLDAAIKAIPHAVWGQYSGELPYTDTTVRTIDLGARPKLVLILPHTGRLSDSGGRTWGGMVFDGQTSSRVCMSITDTGFQVWNNDGIYSRLNESGYTYIYMAML